MRIIHFIAGFLDALDKSFSTNRYWFVFSRFEKSGSEPGNPAYNRLLARSLERIDPRGVPPSVVEAEIANPGSTSVQVITANRGKVVVTVLHR
jgi:hypothetical protein